MRFYLVLLIAQMINMFGCYAVRQHRKVCGFEKLVLPEMFFDTLMIISVTSGCLVAANCIG